ncbi:MAG: nucleotide sugar dehydrogenase [Fibrobacteres bacterium]|nr:nucleotide sugar dehydrogenase [Fibrobacterota bacterium]
MPESFEYDVCVIGGAGHVGLPLSIALADKGRKVIIQDINQSAFALIESGKMPFLDKGAEPMLARVINKTLFATTDPAVAGKSRYVIVVIGTPVDGHLNPELRTLNRLCDELGPNLRGEQVVILRSTLYPGTTERIRNILKKFNPKVEVCFCPERIAQGKAVEELHTLPQIVSGFTPDAIEQVSDLFRLLTKDVLALPPLEAELTKLFTNSYRYIQFAIANQFYMIAGDYGADFHRVYEAMTHNYPRLADFPRPGFASGPCLFKDTMQLSAFTNNKFFLGHGAMLINEGLPNFLVEQTKKRMNLRGKWAGILGMAFKADSDDKRDSLSYKLRKVLEMEAASVLCSDAYIREEGFVAEERLIADSDVIFIGAPHARYKDLDFKGKPVVDVWDFLPFPTLLTSAPAQGSII